MAAFLQKNRSIDAQMRLLVPKKVSDDDKLVDYGAFLLDRFLNVLESLHGKELKETVEKCYEISSGFCKTDGQAAQEKLQELSELLNDLDAGETIVVCSSFSHMLNLGNLAEEVQIASRRPANKKGNIGDENSALTESDMEQTFKRLVKQLGKTPEEIFEALKDQTVDLVFTAHPTQSVRRSLLQKHSR